MNEAVDKEELYRRLAQARRMLGETYDAMTTERLSALVADLEKQIAVVEAKDLDAPSTD